MLFKFINIVFYTVFPLLFFNSCSDSIVVPDDKKSEYKEGLYILCEGLWRQDNSTLSHYDIASASVVNNIFTLANPTLRLGDTGNDIVYYSGKCFVAVSTSKTIEVFQVGTTKSIGRLIFDGKIEPRSITIVNDSVGYVTTLGDDSVIEFNPTTLVKKQRISVGPAPEGITYWKNLVFVANSGYGDFRAKEALAGTVSIIDSKSNMVVQSHYVGPNILSLFVDSVSNNLYCYYAHLPSQKDSLAGIVKYSLPDMQEIHRWRIDQGRSFQLIQNNSSLLYLSNNNVLTLDITKKESQPKEIITNNQNLHIWTGVSLYTIGNTPTIVVSNSKNYTVDGSILFYTLGGQFLKEMTVGLNPTKVCYYSVK